MITTTDELYRRLREADPAAGLDADPNSPVAERVLARVRTGHAASPAINRRSRTLVALVAAIMMVSTGALASGVFHPDPADVATILEDAEQAAEVHLPDWRPELVAETVWCHYQNGESISTYASEFPLDQSLTAERIVAECTSGNDLARHLPEAPTTATLCAATIAPDAYARRMEERSERVLSGDLSQATSVVPVVLGWDTSCEQAMVDTTPRVTLAPMAGAHIAVINEVREVEISLRALAMDRCLSREEAIELSRQAADGLAGEWPLIGLERVFAPDCYQVWVDEWGLF